MLRWRAQINNAEQNTSSNNLKIINNFKIEESRDGQIIKPSEAERIRPAGQQK